jgi:hypothetical protein
MQDKCENCGHEGLIQDKGGTIAFRVASPDGPQVKVIRGFEFWQCPVCGVMTTPWDLVQQVASDPAITNLDLDPPVYPDMSMDPPTVTNHVQIAHYGTDLWNRCRNERGDIRPNLRGAFLKDAKLEFADLHGADLARSVLCGADLTGANLTNADLARANLHAAKLHNCTLVGANLAGADLSGAELVGANMTGANLAGADCCGAKLSGCHVYGVSTWGVRLEGAEQSSLVITPEDEPEISVDGIDIAQFIYLLLSNQKIRDVIESLTSKAVLVLGRFSPVRKAILEAIRGHLRASGYVPIIFDFDGPESQDVLETVKTLAFMSGMVICDISDPRSASQELQAFVESRAIPTAILIQKDQEPWGMLEGLRKYPWFLPTYTYQDINDVVTVLRERVLPDAKAKADELSAERRLWAAATPASTVSPT